MLKPGTYAPSDRVMNIRIDAILSQPAVRRLLADAATVQRVRDAIDRHADNLTPTQRAAFARALNGGTPC
jgi:hypothetical protein